MARPTISTPVSKNPTDDPRLVRSGRPRPPAAALSDRFAERNFVVVGGKNRKDRGRLRTGVDLGQGAIKDRGPALDDAKPNRNIVQRLAETDRVKQWFTRESG